MMGRVQFSFHQTTDILMKGVLSPTLKLLAPFAPGCEPSERASCLGGSHTAEPPTRRSRTRGLSLPAMWSSPLSLLQERLWQHLSLFSPFSKVGFSDHFGHGFNSFTCNSLSLCCCWCTSPCKAVPASQTAGHLWTTADIHSLRTRYSRVSQNEHKWRVLCAVEKLCCEPVAWPPAQTKLIKQSRNNYAVYNWPERNLYKKQTRTWEESKIKFIHLVPRYNGQLHFSVHSYYETTRTTWQFHLFLSKDRLNKDWQKTFFTFCI